LRLFAKHAPDHTAFTLIEIMDRRVITSGSKFSGGVLLVSHLTGGIMTSERKSEAAWLTSGHYAREQAGFDREYGLFPRMTSYQFVAYDARRGLWPRILRGRTILRPDATSTTGWVRQTDGRRAPRGAFVPYQRLSTNDSKDKKPRARDIQQAEGYQGHSGLSASLEGRDHVLGASLGEDTKSSFDESQKGAAAGDDLLNVT